MTDLNDYFYTDGIHDVLAAYVNQLVAGNLRGELSNVETLSANKTLTNASFPIQSVVASGADRDVSLPAVAAANHGFMITNRTATLYSINVKNAGGTVICILRPGATAFFASDGTAGWYCSSGLSTAGGIITGVLNAIQLDVRQLAGQSNDLARFGDGVTNYLAIEPDGTLRFVGAATVFDDVNTSFSGAKVPAANAPTWTTFNTDFNEYTFAVNDLFDLGTLEPLHSWKEGTPMELHVHWATNGQEASIKAVKWETKFCWANTLLAGGTTAFTAAATLSAETSIPANTPTITQMYTSLGSFTPTGGKVGMQIKARIRRIAAAGTAPAANPFGMQFGVHFEKDTLGSRLTSSK